MLPMPVQPGGPAVWCGGRSQAALRRVGRIGDGWVSYVVTPTQYREGLELIAKTVRAGKRELTRFGSGHLLFVCIDDSYEAALDAASRHLSLRYAMDFRGPAKKYAALGRPEAVAESIESFREAGLRHLIVDPVCPVALREEQLERFAREVRPLLRC